jgi:hypothetical protein
LPGYITWKLLFAPTNMKKTSLLSFIVSIILTANAAAQDLKEKDVPATVKAAFFKKYPSEKKVSWEKEKGNYEANWGGKSGEDSSALFTLSASFVKIAVAMQVNQLPAAVAVYVNKHYGAAKIKGAASVTDAAGKHLFEAEIKGKDLIFNEKGVFVKED